MAVVPTGHACRKGYFCFCGSEPSAPSISRVSSWALPGALAPQVGFLGGESRSNAAT